MLQNWHNNYSSFPRRRESIASKFVGGANRKMKIKFGDILEVFGERRTILQSEIGGAPEFTDRRARDKIKSEFLARAKSIIREMPPDLRPKKITIRDTSSRWGSCSQSRAVSLSYRLAFAPPFVMRYVVVHECCHLREMNHGEDFWQLVAEHCPDFASAKKWLKQHGQSLFLI